MKRILVLIFLTVVISLACSNPADDDTDMQAQMSIGLTQTALVDSQTAVADSQTTVAETQAAINQESSYLTLPPEPPAAAPTLAPPTQPALEFDISENGIRIAYDETIAQNVMADSMSATPVEEMIEWSGNPEYVLLSVYDLNGEIAIYPVNAYKLVSAFAQESLDELAFFLEHKPAVAAWGCIPTTYISCSHQEMRANVNFLDFQNGHGVSSVTVYAYQDWAAINNENIEYTFEGLTHDGRYYVQAHFTIRNPVLPDSDWDIPDNAYTDMTGEAFQDYVMIKEEILWGASGDYQPPLATLDALMQSLKIE